MPEKCIAGQLTHRVTKLLEKNNYLTKALPFDTVDHCILLAKLIQLNLPGLITGSIARRTKRRYISYSDSDFEVFRPAGATRCTDGGEI